MKKQCIFLFIFFLTCHVGFAFSISVIDSIGTQNRGGKTYIIHEVEAGETLYALSRRYHVAVGAIKDANDDSANSLSIGQRILIPLPEKLDADGSQVHMVNSSETLFSISRLYGVKVDDLKRWNNLSENSISVGQKLVIKGQGKEPVSTDAQNQQVVAGNRNTHIVEQSQTLYSISRMHKVSTDELIEWNNLGSNALKIGQVLIVSPSGSSETQERVSNSSMLPSTQVEAEEEIEVAEEVKPSPDPVVVLSPTVNETDPVEIEKPAEKVVQKGLAEVIAETENTKKYLALHHDAPIGTIMQVRNEMNNQSVFVRVVGQIQDTGDNAKIILRISKKAYDRLGAVDSRFPVEISYIP